MAGMVPSVGAIDDMAASASRTTDLSPGGSGLTQTSVQSSRSAVQMVSENAQASITLVPVLGSMPSWFAPIQVSIHAAQTRSRTWLRAICPAVSLGLPRAIEDFNIAFQPACTKILNTLEAIGDGTPSGSQKAAIDEGLNSLLIAAQAQAAAATTIKGDLSTYLTGLVSDVKALGDGIGILEASLANGSQYVQTLKNVLTENFIDVQSRLSPCEVIVTMNLNIQVSVDEAGAPQPAIAAVIAQTLVTGLSDNVKNAMDPLQIVMDSWGTLQAKIDAVIADLKSVSSDYVAILRQFDLETARTQWDQLSQYAAGLLPAQSQNIG